MQTENILSLLKTTENANNFISLIDTFIPALYMQNGLKTEDLMQKTFPSYLANEIRKNLSLEKIELKNREEIKKYLTELKGKIENTTTLSLTLAFDPTSAFITMIYRWVNENLAKDFLLLIKTDPKILGGIIIEFSGLYRDYSLKKRIENIFNSNVIARRSPEGPTKQSPVERLPHFARNDN